MNNEIRNLKKWLNEEQETPIDRQALARVLAMAEQPQGVKFNEGMWQEREARIARLEAELMRMKGRELKLQFALAKQPAQQEPVATGVDAELVERLASATPKQLDAWLTAARRHEARKMHRH